MNKKPVLLRTCIAAVVLLVFIWSMFPLRQQDFYKTFEKMLSKKDVEITEAIELAKKYEKEKGLYASVALDQAVTEKNIDLTKYVNLKGLETNRDVLSQVRKNASSSIRLGLDLNGGVEFILALSPDEKADKDQENVKDSEKPKSLEDNFNRYRDMAIERIRSRIEDRKIYESEISPNGEKFISLRVPVVSREEKKVIEDLIKMSAKLEFRLVHQNNEALVQQYQADPKNFKAPSDYEMMEVTQLVSKDQGSRGTGKKGIVANSKNLKKERHHEIYFVYKRPEMGGKDVVDAMPTMDQFGQRHISLTFNSKGANRFAEVTRLNVGRMLAIVLDGKLYSAPVIKQAIEGGRADISGDFSLEEAEAISNALVNGSLPVKIDIAAVFDTDPTLGSEALHNGLVAGLFTTIAICLFMLVYYRRAGVVANVALIANIFIMLGALAAFECTLTLPGIAGLVLTVGMAVDANVLIYERIREELAKNKTVGNAIDLGYGRAFTTILDSNMTTLFVGLILYWVGTGPIKGFAITLSIGIITSMFTALFLTRLIFDLMMRYMPFRTLTMMKFFERPNFDFMSLRHVTMAISGIMIAVCLVTTVIRGKDMLGIDFTGGTQILMDYNEKMRVPETDIKTTLGSIGL